MYNRGAVQDPEYLPSPVLVRLVGACPAQFCAGFFHQYNYIHRHSGIAWHTPALVHFGTADTIDQARQNTLTALASLAVDAERVDVGRQVTRCCDRDVFQAVCNERGAGARSADEG